MKRILLLLAIVVLLVGCAGEVVEEGYEKPAAEVEEPEVTQKELPSETAPAEKQTPTVTSGPSVIGDELKALITKADSVTSLEYSYSQFIEGEKGYYAHVWVKEPLMKQDIELGSGTYSRDTFYDTAYVNLAKGTVEAYCEDENCEDRNKVITTDIGKFVTETPFDVLNSIDSGYKKGTAMFENRGVVIVEYEDMGNTIRVWLWDYKGIPLKYEMFDGETLLKRVEFQNLVYNGVKDAELAHKQLE